MDNNRIMVQVFTALDRKKKAWITTEIMVQVFAALDRKLDVENRKVSLFLDNTPSHQRILRNIKLVFLPQNNTS